MTNTTHQEDIQATALKMYLEPYKAKLDDFNEPLSDFKIFIERIFEIVNSLDKIQFCIGDKPEKPDIRQYEKIKKVSVCQSILYVAIKQSPFG